MKKFLLFLFLCNNLALFSQERHLIFFDKKASVTIHTYDNVLSKTALNNRAKHQISFDWYDQRVNEKYLSELAASNVKVISTSKWLNAALVEVPTSNVKLTSQFPFIRKDISISNTKSYNVSKFAAVNSNDASINNPARVDNSANTIQYGSAKTQNELFEIEYLHDLGYTGNGITMAFLDAGYLEMDNFTDPNSQFDTNQIIDSYNYWNSSENVYVDHDHGTSVSSVVIGNSPGYYVGMAPNVDVALYLTDHIITETHQDEFFYVKALERADSLGIVLVNASLSYQYFDPNEGDYEYSDMDGNTAISTLGAKIAVQKGMLIVNSCGNSGHLKAPSDAPGILPVGGANRQKNYDMRSSVGPTFDGRYAPMVAGLTQNTYYILPDGTVGSSSYGGTSAAAPFISGIAACLMEAHPNRSSAEIIDAIKQSSHQYSAPDYSIGHGVPNARIADSILNIIDDVADLIDNTSQVSVFPNPSLTSSTFHSDVEISSLKIFTVSGQLQKELPDINKSTITIHHTATGIFLYQTIDVRGTISTGKIIVSP